MPAAYAHYRFAHQALDALPGALCSDIRDHIQLFDLGLHGPDPLFYHKILGRSPLWELASRYHHIPGKELFETLCARLREEPMPGDGAFLFGLLAHYCLDSVCHPFIVGLDEAGECPHSELETEFDRFLLTLDGESAPHTRDLGAHLHPTAENLRVMVRFFPPVTDDQMKQCMRNMVWVNRLLSGKGLLPRGILERVIPLAGETAKEQLMPKSPIPRAEKHDGKLMSLYNQALERFPALAGELSACYAQGSPLSDTFTPIMG